jgi:serine/threonine protein kinase
MVIELVEGGTLTDCLDLEYPMPEQAIAYVCKEILKGLKVKHTPHTHTTLAPHHTAPHHTTPHHTHALASFPPVPPRHSTHE